MSGRGIALVPFENMINETLGKIGYDTRTEVYGHGFRTLACSVLVESVYGQKTL